jgi:hypothetical protein
LTNVVFTVSRGGESLHLCGLDDIWKGDVLLKDVLAQLPDEGVAILRTKILEGIVSSW